MATHGTSSDRPEARSATLDAWRTHDEARALDAADRAAIRETEAPRSLVAELLATGVVSRDLYSACAALGRLLADAGASPTLAATTLDGAVRALPRGASFDDADLAPARASVAEGYVASIREKERAVARAAWEYPNCAVRVDDETLAVAAHYPTADIDPLAVADWAARVALGASRDKARYVVVSGPPELVAEVTDALTLVGIEVVDRPPRRWFRLPFGRAARGTRG